MQEVNFAFICFLLWFGFFLPELVHGLDDNITLCCDLDEDETHFYFVVCDYKEIHNVRYTHYGCPCAVLAEGSGVNAAGCLFNTVDSLQVSLGHHGLPA